MIRISRYAQLEYNRIVARYDLCWIDGKREMFASYTDTKNVDLCHIAISAILNNALERGAYNFEKLPTLMPQKTEHLKIPSWYYL